MKKFLALVVSLMMAFACVSALAENVELANVDFGDFTIGVPADWTEVELTDEQVAQSIIYAVVNSDQTRSMTVAFTEAEVTAESVLAELSANEKMTEVQSGDINGFTIVTFTLSDMNQTGFVLPVEGGFYTFYFMPASDDAFAPIAQAILMSIAAPAAQ